MPSELLLLLYLAIFVHAVFELIIAVIDKRPAYLFCNIILLFLIISIFLLEISHFHLA